MSGEDKERSPPTVISIHDFFPGCSQAEILLYKAIGLCIATLVGSLYYIVPLMFVALPFWVLYSKFALVPSIIFLGWMILSYWPISLTSGPPKSWFYKFLALYFDSELLLESSKEVYSKHTKPIVWMAFPHGVIAFSGSAYGYMYRARQVHTATADIVLRMPLIRHVFGVFNLTSGSRKSLETHLKKEREDVWIYPGGLAELFLSSPDKEEIFFEKRKGIVRLAMETGADITVTYLFGNSLVYSLLCSRQTAWVSRQMKISLTLFLGSILLRHSSLYKTSGSNF
eukprot:Gregarina_sp_Poly_1__2690@NODE_173_length_12050_cov_429_537511_g154_i0_p5_GENE_NODE_173_length_12050_cov_429_537511_g154_i0NODE_173_length_12050_cov_429_537511_g154_i0_p5_ORF_typecomplete_len284_score17_46DAGAT/PF03982_13/1_6e30DUF3487/PF11990_8/0_32DUF3487/PF11990_8/6_1e02DUF3487/PF11990_8/69Acyltransferase/PF01553_21/0_03COX7a/PF02238_15/1_7COX7a/PF02238_15/2_2e02Arc_PepC_II/PF06847_11/9_5e03Arc_PepC_II/PF06847_11/0_36_NODE_173_length_12050_cov_429_537511_g154_i078048655